MISPESGFVPMMAFGSMTSLAGGDELHRDFFQVRKLMHRCAPAGMFATRADRGRSRNARGPSYASLEPAYWLAVSTLRSRCANDATETPRPCPIHCADPPERRRTARSARGAILRRVGTSLQRLLGIKR